MARIVFDNANLLDGDRPARPGMQVIVDGDRIASVSPQAEPTETGDLRIDLAGKTLMPGLVTTHFHSSYDNITIHAGASRPRDAARCCLTLIAARHLRWALESGFTSGRLARAAINDRHRLRSSSHRDRRGRSSPARASFAGGRGLDTTGGYLRHRELVVGARQPRRPALLRWRRTSSCHAIREDVHEPRRAR